MLYIVATPIGNMQDITLRALEVLRSVDFIICEDTRITGKLLHHFEIKKPMKALNEYNEKTAIYEILDEILLGKSAAIVSDAGTPLISDPGFPLVKLAKEKGVLVISIPGPTALITALSSSGLPTDSFMFQGFLPKRASKIEQFFDYFRSSVCSNGYSPTLVFYESPHRIIKTVKIMLDVLGDHEVVIARELTKIHEEVIKMKVSEFIIKYDKASPKGELVILMSLKTN